MTGELNGFSFLSNLEIRVQLGGTSCVAFISLISVKVPITLDQYLSRHDKLSHGVVIEVAATLWT